MECPKCGHQQQGGAECGRCGVIFAKISSRPEPDGGDITAAHFQSPLATLLEPDSLTIRQEPRGLLEILTDWEIANEYTISDGVGRIRGFAVEQGRGAGAGLTRTFLGSRRPFHIAVLAASEREVILELNRPFVILFSRVTVTSGARTIGTIRRRFSLLHRTYDLADSGGKVFARIAGPLLRIWTFPVFDLQGNQRAEIVKKWSGLRQEYFTDADTFRLSFRQAAWTVEQRAVVLAAALSIDFDFFENNNRR
jgi:uncharacterized protein YxjI